MLRTRQFRFLLAGGWNTLFGYSVGVGFYLWLSSNMHVALIGGIASVLSITMSFLTYKIFVFRSSGRWIAEYLRSYVVYGSSALISVIILWLLIDGLYINIWIAQGITILLTVVISYIGHARYTFKK